MRYGKSKARIIGTWAGDKDCLFKSFCSNKRYRSLYFRGLGLQIKDFLPKGDFWLWEFVSCAERIPS